MIVTNSPYFREFARNRTSTGLRKLRRYIRHELNGCRRALESELRQRFAGQKLTPEIRAQVKETIAATLDAYPARPFPDGPYKKPRNS